MVWCGDQCVSLASPENCGACGYRCAGQCIDGRCIEVTPLGIDALDVSIGSEVLVIAERSSGRLLRYRTGSNAIEEIGTDGPFEADAVRLCRDRVVFRSGGALFQVPIAGGVATRFPYKGADAVGAFAAYGSAVLFEASGSHSVWRWDLDAGTVIVVESEPADVFAVGGYGAVYAPSGRRELVVQPLSTATPRTVFPATGRVLRVSFCGSRLYWIAEDASALFPVLYGANVETGQVDPLAVVDRDAELACGPSGAAVASANELGVFSASGYHRLSYRPARSPAVLGDAVRWWNPGSRSAYRLTPWP